MSTKGNLLCHISSFNRYHSRTKIVEQHLFGVLLSMALGQHIVFTDIPRLAAIERPDDVDDLPPVVVGSATFLAVCAVL